MFHKVFHKLQIQWKALATMEDPDGKALDAENKFSAEIP